MWRKKGLRFGEINQEDNHGGLSLFLARTLSVGLVITAWWECLFSVFPMQISRSYLYVFLFIFSGAVLLLLNLKGIKGILLVGVTGGVLLVYLWQNYELIKAVANTVANAYLDIHYVEGNFKYNYDIPVISPTLLSFGMALAFTPISAVLCFGQGRKRGRVPIALLLSIPFVFSTVEGYFPSPESCAFMVISAGIYFSVCKINTRKTVWREMIMAGAILFILSAWAWGVSGFIETKKENNNYQYYELRAFVSAQFIQPLEEKLIKENKEESVQRKKTQNADVKLDEEKKTNIDNDTPDIFSFDNSENIEEQNLQSISHFKPEDTGDLTVVTDTLPDSTYYLPIQYGKKYEDSSWKSFADDDKVYAEYSQYPGNLSQLIKRCKSQTFYGTEDVASFIQKEFEENTVYDYYPGATPQNWDFAEYFLFQNQKGFCVHFATTAVLMYRISGIQARYAEGYAVPVSAFVAAKDGTFIAKVTGDMGHAWCETYDNGWVIREHTLPYKENTSAKSGPAASSPSSEKLQEKRSMNPIVLTFLVFVAGFLIFLFQAAARRRIYLGKIKKYAKGRGILMLYLVLSDWAGVLGVYKGDDIDEDMLSTLGEALPEVTDEQWIWIRDKVLQTRFGMEPPDKETYKKFYILVLKCVSAIWKRLTLWEKIKCRYIKCLP